MTETEPRAVDGPTRAESIVKLLLGVVGLFVLLFLLTLVPPFERRIPGTPITFEALLTAVVVVVIFGLFVVVADQLGELTRERLGRRDEGDELPMNAGTTVRYLVVFLAFLVMYRPLADATVPFLVRNDTPWVYDLTFSVVSLVLLALVAYYAYRCIDPVTTRISGEFLSEESSDERRAGTDATDEAGARPGESRTEPADGDAEGR